MAEEDKIETTNTDQQEQDDQKTLNALQLKQINNKIIVEISRKTTLKRSRLNIKL